MFTYCSDFLSFFDVLRELFKANTNGVVNIVVMSTNFDIQCHLGEDHVTRKWECELKKTSKRFDCGV